MKYLFIFLLVPLLSQGQKGSYLGVYANTGIYKLYNYNDWHTNKASDQFGLIIDPQKSDVSKLYNSTFGISFGHSYNERNSIEMSLGLANFRQDYVIDNTVFPGKPVYYYYYSKLEYTSFHSSWFHNFIKRSSSEIKPEFYVTAGMHFSYINNYLEQGAQTEYFTSGPYTHYSIQQITNNNGAIEASTFADNQATTYGYSTTSSIFNKINYGINLGFGVSKKLNDRLNIKLGCTIEYDFSNAEDFSATLSKINTTTLDYYRFNSRILHTYSSKERKSTHNIYYGFGFSFAWYLKRQSY